MRLTLASPIHRQAEVSVVSAGSIKALLAVAGALRNPGATQAKLKDAGQSSGRTQATPESRVDTKLCGVDT